MYGNCLAAEGAAKPFPIYAFVATEAGADRARRVIARIIEAAERLRSFPYLGNSQRAIQTFVSCRFPLCRSSSRIASRGAGSRFLRIFHEAQERPDHWER